MLKIKISDDAVADLKNGFMTAKIPESPDRRRNSSYPEGLTVGPVSLTLDPSPHGEGRGEGKGNYLSSSDSDVIGGCGDNRLG